ncbi:MAG: SCO6745 family protein [Acidimicrobiia bacterium]
MEPVVARKTWRTLEPLHGLVYFAPEAPEEYASLGLVPSVGGYFASRAAPMGAVPAEVVMATFFNFRPSVVRDEIPLAWSLAAPTDIVAARFRAACRALRGILGDGADAPEIAEAAGLARAAALRAADHVEGRPLFAAHASLDWPDEPLLVLWHAQSLLREYRGDGHISVLVGEGISGIEALVIHGGTGEVPRAKLQATRGWHDDEWEAAAEGLRSRGWLAGDGTLTDTGRAHHQGVEDRTDALALPAYEALGEADCARLRTLARPWAKAVVESSMFGFANRTPDRR